MEWNNDHAPHTNLSSIEEREIDKHEQEQGQQTRLLQRIKQATLAIGLKHKGKRGKAGTEV